jgi:hypothetical protein
MIQPLNKDPFALDDSAAGSGRRWLPWALAALLVTLVAGAWYLWQSMSEPKPRPATSAAPKPGLPPPSVAGPSGSGTAPGAGVPGMAGGAGAGLSGGAGPQAANVGAPGSMGPGASGTGSAPPATGGPGSPGVLQGGPGPQGGAIGSGGQAGAPGPGQAEAAIAAGAPRYPIERSLAGAGPIDPGTATLDPPAADKAISNALSTLPGREQILRFALPSEVVRRVVLTIDNLPGDTMSMQYRAVNAIGGPLRIERQGQAIVLGAANSGRYDEFVKMATGIDTRRLVGLYKRFYPLFQQEYTSIGYPDRHFNDRVVEAIDDMLATPITQGPTELIQPRVLYEYADPGLERRSVGQRIIMRMGPEHAQKLKAKLREIRTALTNETR